MTWRFHTGIYNGRTLLGVAIVGNPVAPGLNGRGIAEVNRLCIRRDTADALRWNAASMLYGWCAREAARQGWRKIITYTRVDEPGTSLRAAGWTQECRVRGRGWHSARRARSNTNSWIDKVRWSPRAGILPSEIGPLHDNMPTSLLLIDENLRAEVFDTSRTTAFFTE